MKRFVVIGLGRFGAWIARELHRQGFDVIAIDTDEDRVDRFAHEVTRAVAGDATDPEILRRAGVEGAEAAVVSTGTDLATGILSTLALKELGVKRIFAKVSSLRAAQAMSRFDIDEMIFPEREVAQRVAYRLATTAVLEYMPLGDRHSIQEIAIPDAWLGRSLRELGLRSQGIQVVAIHDTLTDEWFPVPDPDRRLRDSDVAIVAGVTETVETLVARASGG